MIYETKFSDSFKHQFIKIKKKDKLLFERLKKKIKEIKQNPLHYKPLKNKLKGFRRAHVNSFVIMFKIVENKIHFDSINHHDVAYREWIYL